MQSELVKHTLEIYGPFKQILPLTSLSPRGSLKDSDLQVIHNGAVVVENKKVITVGDFQQLYQQYKSADVVEQSGKGVLLPGFVDCHTHICFAGSRATDYAQRNAGKTYLEIASSGGGIWDTVTQTRACPSADLEELLLSRIERHLQNGVTTIEIKSGYGLSLTQELKQLRAIKEVKNKTKADLISTCLAALPPLVN